MIVFLIRTKNFENKETIISSKPLLKTFDLSVCVVTVEGVVSGHPRDAIKMSVTGAMVLVSGH